MVSEKNVSTLLSDYDGSSELYNSRLYRGLKFDVNVDLSENHVPSSIIDRIFCKSCENMEELPDNSVHLMVTSPPYNVGKEYDKDLTLDEYRSFLKKVWREVYRVLVPGGRACVNITDIGRRPCIPLYSYVLSDMIDVGFLNRGCIIWDKGVSAGRSIARGSFMSASNPVLWNVHEFILVFSKASFDRRGGDKKSTMSKQEFMEYTESVWRFRTDSAKRVGHPAPFPVELPLRCIKLYTFMGDVVLDPFMGSGTTAVAAIRCGRHYVGYEMVDKYVDLAYDRINREYLETRGIS